jgi:hypothetical protein
VVIKLWEWLPAAMAILLKIHISRLEAAPTKKAAKRIINNENSMKNSSPGKGRRQS